MEDPWDRLSQSINSIVADNEAIAWPVVFKHLSGLKQGSQVVDYGCGSGRFCMELYKRGYVVNGIDTSKELTKLARNGSSKEIKYFCGGEEELENIGKDVDAITSIMVLQFVRDIIPFVNAAHACLREGGIVSITVFNPDFVSRCEGKFFKNLKNSNGILTAKRVWIVESQFEKVAVKTYIRNIDYYKKVFEESGFKLCSSEFPPFTKEFLEINKWDLPSDVPEYLIMKFKKLEN